MRFMRYVALLLIILLHFTSAKSQTDCPPVTKLKTLYSNDRNFRLLMDSVFSHVYHLPDGSANYWKDKTIADLYVFLNHWFYRLPTVANGMEDIVTFSMLYYHNLYGLKFVNQEPGLSWSLDFAEEQGKYMDSRQSAGSIPQWMTDSSLHNDEYIMPKGGDTSFNQFFTRELKPGMRPVARPNDNSVLVAPADGIIDWLNLDLNTDTALPIKGRMKMNLNQLLANSTYASLFVGGSAMRVILLPRNYHHFHSPVTGRLVESKQDAGHILFGSQLMDFLMTGVSDMSTFENYKHGYFVFKTDRYGYVAMIPVGLETVGSVVFEEAVRSSSKGNEIEVTKGQRLGHFAYGGSMVILLFQKGRMHSITVQQGQQIGIFSK